MLKKAFPWLRDKGGPQMNGGLLLKGEKVVIRERRLKDVSDDYAWRTDEELARLDATLPISMSYDNFLRHSREELVHGNPSSRRLAIDTLSGLHIGNCMYYDIDFKHGQAELGIMIGDRGYWSKGYGADSVEVLLSHIFTSTPLSLIYLHTLDWNQRARRSFAKSGFRETKNVRRGGLDFVLMEINRSDWERRRDGRRNGQPTVGTFPRLGAED